jgi:hypothetical protein
MYAYINFHSISICYLARVERFELPTTVLETGMIPFHHTRKLRKREDGSVDISFYNRLYSGLYLQTPTITTGINSQVIVIVIPRLTFVGREGFEPPYSEESRFTVCRL